MTDPRKILSPLARLVFGGPKRTRAPAGRPSLTEPRSQAHPFMTQRNEAILEELMLQGSQQGTASALGLRPENITKFTAPYGPGRHLLDQYLENINPDDYNLEPITALLRPAPTDQMIVDALQKFGGNQSRAAKWLGFDRKSLNRRVIQQNLAPRKAPASRRVSDADADAVFQRIQTGEPLSRIAESIGISAPAMGARVKTKKYADWLKTNGLEHPKKELPQYEQVFKEYIAGAQIKDLATKYGVTAPNINLHLNRIEPGVTSPAAKRARKRN